MGNRKNVQVPQGFTPREYQKPLYNCIRNGKKRAITVWHRRAGKDKCFLSMLAGHAIEKPGIYFYILPTYKQCRKVLWDGMDSFGNMNLDVFPEEIIAHKNNQEMVLTLINKSKIYFLGSDNIDSIVGTNPIGIFFSEYSLHKPHVWDFLRPILVENGGFAVFNGTPRGKNHMYRMLEAAKKNPDEWFWDVMTIEDTGVMTPEDVEKEIEEGMDRATAMQEFYCSFDAALTGAYYDEAMQTMESDGRIHDFSVERQLPVHVAWDLGINDTMVLILYQKIGKDIYIVETIDNNGKGLDWYVKQLQMKPYVLGHNLLPHDIKVRELGNGGKSRLQALRDLGLQNLHTIDKAALQDGINCTRGTLYRIHIHTRCSRLIEALKTYRRAYDEVLQVYNNQPVHDWASHFADAVRILALGDRDEVDVKSLVDTAEGTGYDPLQAMGHNQYDMPAYMRPFSHRPMETVQTWSPLDHEVADGFYS